MKPLSNKPSARWHDVYEVEPQRASISAHDYIYATVTFTPPSMQSYSAIFEAAVDGMPSVVSKYRNLTFDIQGKLMKWLNRFLVITICLRYHNDTIRYDTISYLAVVSHNI